MSEIDALPPTYTLRSADLLSKSGFGDGDLFDDLCWALETDQGIQVHGQQVLVAAVRKWLVPALHHRIELVEIGTIHNPIRASTIDGVSASDFWYGDTDAEGELSPISVEVRTADILDLAQSLVAIEGTFVEVAPIERRLANG